MKTIGVLGGLGPQATMDIEARIHAVSQRLIPPRGNEGYPPLVVYYHRWPPVIVDENRAPILPIRVDPRLLDAARWLGARADFLVIGSNGVHHLADELSAAAGRPILSMIDVTVAEVKRRGWQAVGLLTFREPSVYQQPLTALGIRCEVVPDGVQAQLDAVAPAVSSGQAGVSEAATMRAAVDLLRGRGVDGVILGCTEFPFALGPEADAPDLINPAALLAEAAVCRALS